MRAGRLGLCWLWILTGTTATLVAQNPFSGTWKMNQEKSQMGGDTLKIRPAQGQGFEIAGGGVTYSFRTDGNPYAMPSGDLAVWRETSPVSWSTEYRKSDGKLRATDSWKLSADGKTLSVTTSGVRADGELYTDNEMYARSDASTGLTGTWKGTEIKMSSPSQMTIQTPGLDGLVLMVPEQKMRCEAHFDGKDARMEGPDVSPGMQLSFARTGPYTFHLTQKLNGSTIRTSVFTVSEERDTMTEVGGVPGDPETTVVWEKQP